MTDNVESQEVQQEEVKTEAAPVEESKESAPPSDETPKPEESESKAEVEEPKLTQKQVDEAIQKRLARESRKLERQIRAEVENEYLRQQIQSQQAPKVEQPSGEPKPESFKTYEEYIRASVKWENQQSLLELQKEVEQQKQFESQRSYEARIKESLSKPADKYEDFYEVVSDENLAITPVMGDAMAESEIGGEIFYYLGNNPKEAERIAGLSNVQQVKAIDRLEAKLKAPQVTKAPPPAETVGKGRAKTEPDPANMSVAEYAEYRKKSGARWAK